jgi:hypothetical protein
MKTITVKRSNQFFVVSAQIRVLVDGNDVGEIKNGETKKIECENDTPVLRFESTGRNLQLNLKLKENNNIEVYWNRNFGFIGYKDPNSIVESKKREINWKNYLLIIAVFAVVMYFVTKYLIAS